jgi:hypothetical protein
MKKILTFTLLLATGATAMAQNCEPEDGIEFICGLNAVEDLVRVGDSRWLLGSGLGGPGRPGSLVLIDTVAGRGEVVYPLPGAPVAHDADRFAACAAPPDPAVFNAHGVTLREIGAGRYEFLVINHGGREAVEFFAVDARGTQPQLTWIGCVQMPDDTYMNSLDSLPDGGFISTLFYRPSQGGMGAVFAGNITGGLLQWRPGEPVSAISETDVSGANGIALTDGGRVIHVAAWGSREMVRFERRGDGLVRTATVPVDFAPDNLRWTSHGLLLVAGQKFSASGQGPVSLDGWTVATFDPDTLELMQILKEVDGSASFQGVSTALDVDGTIWVGPFSGDRVGYFPKP